MNQKVIWLMKARKMLAIIRSSHVILFGPSAYASGALVKCRKVGAKNWGNKTKKESVDYSNWRDDFQALEIETIDLIKADPIEVPPSRIDIIKEGAKKKNQVRVTNVGDTLKKSVDNQIMTDPN